MQYVSLLTCLYNLYSYILNDEHIFSLKFVLQNIICAKKSNFASYLDAEKVFETLLNQSITRDILFASDTYNNSHMIILVKKS